MIRNIMDWAGNVVGQLELPDETPESVWTEKLLSYSQPVVKTADQIVTSKVAAAERFGKALLQEVSTDNILAGASIEQINNLIAIHKDTIIMLMSGSLYTALDSIDTIETDDLLTQERLDKYAAKLRAYLGI